MLREATRRAGVAPNAAYRHFTNRDDLLGAVRAAAVAQAAQAMEDELVQLPATGMASARTVRAWDRAICALRRRTRGCSAPPLVAHLGWTATPILPRAGAAG